MCSGTTFSEVDLSVGYEKNTSRISRHLYWKPFHFHFPLLNSYKMCRWPSPPRFEKRKVFRSYQQNIVCISTIAVSWTVFQKPSSVSVVLSDHSGDNQEVKKSDSPEETNQQKHCPTSTLFRSQAVNYPSRIKINSPGDVRAACFEIETETYRGGKASILEVWSSKTDRWRWSRSVTAPAVHFLSGQLFSLLRLKN